MSVWVRQVPAKQVGGGGAWGVLFCVAVVSVLQVVSDHRRVCVFVEWCALKSEAKRTCNCVQCFCAAPPTSRQIRKFKRSQSQMSHASADLARTGWWCTDLLKANRQCQPLDGEAGTAHVNWAASAVIGAHTRTSDTLAIIDAAWYGVKSDKVQGLAGRQGATTQSAVRMSRICM